MTIDLLDPGLRVDGSALARAAELRAKHGSVVWQPRGAGFWAILGLDEAREVLTQPKLFSSTRGTRPGMQRPRGQALPLHNLDPPAHRAARREANALLAPQAVVVPTELLSQLVAAPFDGVRDVATPLATLAIGEALGVPDEARATLATSSHDAHRAAAHVLEHYPNVPAAAQRRAKAASHELFRVIARTFPDGNEELLRLMVQAGWVTLVDGISGALWALATHTPRPPHAAPEIASDAAVEELLRFVSPINQFARTVTCDTLLADQKLRAGEQVVVFFAAANRDPAAFHQADELCLERSPNPHVAFGAGPHRCPGTRMTRQYLRAVLQALDQLGVVPAAHGVAARRRSSFLNGFDALPLQLTPRLGAPPLGAAIDSEPRRHP